MPSIQKNFTRHLDSLAPVFEMLDQFASGEGVDDERIGFSFGRSRPAKGGGPGKKLGGGDGGQIDGPDPGDQRGIEGRFEFDCFASGAAKEPPGRSDGSGKWYGQEDPPFNCGML